MARQDDDQREARRILERTAQETDGLAHGLLARQARRAGEHFSASDADPDDWAELWGRRIGRAGAFVVTVLMIGWLVNFLVGG